MQTKPQQLTEQRVPPEIRCAQDYESLAAGYIDAPTLAYIAGGSGSDRTVRANRTAFDRHAVLPRVLHDVSDGNTRVRLPGAELPHPILLAPVALQHLVHADGECATARAADVTQSCLIASSLSSVTLEDIARHSTGPKWFQLYFQPVRAATHELLRRAEAAGYDAIVVTLDAALQLPSQTALAAGFRMPAAIRPANFTATTKPEAAFSNLFQAYMHSAVCAEDLSWLLHNTTLPVWVKGVLHVDDARTMRALGVAGIIVSNHGGRSLDGAPASLAMLPGVRAAVGANYPVLFDGGVRSGADVFKAIALGADAVLIGRLQVYALAVAGALGVAHLVKLLSEELELHMASSGCCSIAAVRGTALHSSGDNGSASAC